jgi:hypothetical protein
VVLDAKSPFDEAESLVGIVTMPSVKGEGEGARYGRK